MVAIVVILFHLAALGSSLLSDAGNWAAILAATILVLGLIVGWFRQVSHSLHVVGETVGLHVPPGRDRGIDVILGTELLNTSSIPLNYQVVSFTATLGSREAVSLTTQDDQRAYVAPHQRLDWHGEAQVVEAEDFPFTVAVRYEVEYGRKSRWLWWWRRVVRGSYRADVPRITEAVTLLAEPLDGPPTDSRVPLTSLSVFGWRL